jgi:alkanesulfonate monooxygenase SsuD/methylene tetrahydromethanopterin reductase-like flavin-dependent oxidoreductase (luciferase family)
VSLAYLADHTERIKFGSLVAPLSFRDPVMLARQGAALDDLSAGRMILGVGAGWLEGEHTMFGYELGTMRTRMARLEEGLEVITRLLRSETPITYTGRFYQLREATLRPRPQRPGGPPILVGGTGSRRALPLVARYADVWNAAGLTPEEFRERSAYLDRLLRQGGRQRGEVKRTLMVPVFCGRDRDELGQRMIELRRIFPHVADRSPGALLDLARTQFRAMFRPIVGTPKQVVERIRAYAQAGVEELMVQCFVVDDLSELELLSEEVLPQLRG